MSTVAAPPICFVVVRSDKTQLGPVYLGQTFVDRWKLDLQDNPCVRASRNHLVLQVATDTPLDFAAMRLFTHVWELLTLAPDMTAHVLTTTVPLPLETNLEPRTIVLAWQLASTMQLEAPYRLLLSLALHRLTPQTIWDYLGVCGEFNRPGNPRHSYEWRLRRAARPMVAAFVPWLYFCLRPQALDEYRMLMELIARSEPALIKETLPPLLDGMRGGISTATERTYQARVTFVACDDCASNHDPHTNTRCFTIPDIRLKGMQGPVRCQMIVRPSGVRALCHQAPSGVQYGLELISYDTANAYSTVDRRDRGVGIAAADHSDEIPMHPQARFHSTCYQCGGRDRPVYIAQLLLGVQQKLAPPLDPVWRTCQSEANRALLVPSRSHSPAPAALSIPSPRTPIG